MKTMRENGVRNRHDNTLDGKESVWSKAKSFFMRGKRKIDRAVGFENHIAFFGESGSGKTTLLNAFYGFQQSGEFSEEAHYRLCAEDKRQGDRLLSQYLKFDGETPPTRLTSTEYSFLICPNFQIKKKLFRLVWHDYPGEWLTQGTQTSQEQRRMERTIDELIQSNVAFLLLDGAKFKKEGGKYIKKMLTNFEKVIRDVSKRLKTKKKLPLRNFPRIWYIALSKSDLVPQVTAESLRDTVLRVANRQLEKIEDAIATLVDARTVKQLDVSGNFILLSASRVDVVRQKVLGREIKGIDAIAPVSFFAPVERMIKWSGVRIRAKKTMGGVLTATTVLITVVSALAALIVGAVSLGAGLPIVGLVVGALSTFAGAAVLPTLSALMAASIMAQRAVKTSIRKAEDKKQALDSIVLGMKYRLDGCRRQKVVFEQFRSKK